MGGHKSDRERSKKICVLWSAALGMLALLGLVSWKVVMPVLQVRGAVTRCAAAQDNGMDLHDQIEIEIEQLGGEEAAADKLAVCLRLPERAVPDRLNTLRLLDECGKQAAAAFPQLVELQYHSDREVRIEAVAMLGWDCGPRAVEPLIAALTEGPADTRWIVARALGRHKDRRAVEPLINVIGDGTSDVSAEAAEALGKIGDRRAEGPLIDALQQLTPGCLEFGPGVHYVDMTKDEAKEAQRHAYSFASAAAKALGRFGDPDAVEPLVELLKSGSGRSIERPQRDCSLGHLHAALRMEGAHDDQAVRTPGCSGLRLRESCAGGGR